MYRPIVLKEKPGWFASLMMVPGMKDPWPRGFLGTVKNHARTGEPIIVLWSEESIQKAHDTQLPSPINEDTGWLETPDQSFIAFDINTGMLRPYIDAGDYDGTRAKEEEARVQAKHAAAEAGQNRIQRAIDQLRVELRNLPVIEPQPQGYTIDDEPFATYFRLGLTFMDEDRDIIWVIGERPFHAYRISTGRDDPTVVPRPTDFSNMDSIARAESHLNEWKARDEAALQGNVETGGDGSGIARAAREDQNMSDAQMQVSLPPANGSFSKNMANKRQGIDERTNTQSSPKSFGLSLAQMREIWTQFNSSPTMAIHSTMREQAQVTWAKPTAGGQSSSLPKLLAPAPQSTLDTTSHAQAHRKRKVDENDQLDRSSSPKQPRAAQSDSAPINGPRSRTPQQTQGRIVRPPSTSAGQFGRPEKRTHTEYQEDQESMTETASRRRMDWTERKTSSRNSTHQPSVRASELVDPRIGRTAISRDPLTLRSSSGPTFGAPIRYFYPPAPVTAYRELRYESMDRASVASDDMAAAPIAEAAMMTSHQDKRRRASQPEREGLTAESPSSVQQRSPSRQTRMHGRGQSHRHYGQGSNQTQSVPMTTQPRGQRSVGDWMSQQSTNVAGAYSPSLSVHSKLVTFQLLLVPAQERSRSLPIYWTMWNSNRHWPWTSLLATTATGRLGDHLICFPQMSSSMASNRLRLTGACHHHRPAVDHLLSTFSLAA